MFQVICFPGQSRFGARMSLKRLMLVVASVCPCLLASGLAAGQSTGENETPTSTVGLGVISHIIVLAQENRSFDHYFGQLRQYWAQNGYPDQSFDGLPQFNPHSGTPPLWKPPPSNPGCDPAKPPPSDCIVDTQNPVVSFELST